MTLRESARAAVEASATEAATYAHHRNYHKLHVRRDGSVNWFESINQSDDIIDDQAERFAAVPSVITVGTGSCSCNCDHCDDVYSADAEQFAIEQGHAYDRENKYATQADAIDDAIGDVLWETEEEMLNEFDRIIPIGYFNDEDPEDEASIEPGDDTRDPYEDAL